MFEMHVYTDKFFSFVKKIIDQLHIYDLQLLEIVNPDYAQISLK